MDPTPLMVLDATITHRSETGTRTARGNQTQVLTTSATRCWVEQPQARGRAGETTVGMSVGDEDWRGYFPPTDVIDHTDTIDVAGYGTFEVAAPPWKAYDPVGRRFTHIEVQLRRTT